MKTISCIFALFLFCTALTFGQNWFIGGNVSFEFDKAEAESESNSLKTEGFIISVSPSIGYNINKFDFGINPKFRYSKSESKSISGTTKSEYSGFGLGLFSRYNFLTFNRFSILGRFDTNYLYLINTSLNSDSSTELNNHQFSINISCIFWSEMNTKCEILEQKCETFEHKNGNT